MNRIILEKAQKSLPQLARNVIDNVDQTLINLDDGNAVVLLSLEQINAWQETMYLLSTPANTAHLTQSIAEDRAGNRIKRALLDA